MRRGSRAAWIVAGAAVAVGLLLGLWLARTGGAGPPLTQERPPPGATAARPASTRSADEAPSADRHGRVMLAVGTLAGPAPAAKVRLFSAAPPRSAEPWTFVKDVALDPTGAATLTLAPGPFLLTAEADGAWTSHALEVFESREVTVWLTLERTWRAALRVVEKDTGNPVPLATAVLVTHTERTGFPTFDTGLKWTGDSLGHLELDALPAGDVTLRVSAPSHLAQGVTLAAAERTDAQQVVLEPASWVEGTVRDENGTPIDKARVTGSSELSATTNAAGVFRLAASPGDAVLAALDPAGRSATARVVVPERGTLRGVDIRLGDPRRVEGRVLDALSSAPVPGAQVVAEPPHGDAVVARAVTGADGRFQLDGLPPGWVSITATLGRGAHGTLRSVSTATPGPVELRLDAPAALWGMVRDAKGRLVAGAQVRARGLLSGEELQATTDETGTFGLDDLEPGRWRVSAAVGAEALSNDTEVLLSSGAAHRVDLAVDRAATVEGVVVGSDGPWIVVALPGGRSGSGLRRVSTRPGGGFTLRLHPGKWSLSTSSNSGPLVVWGGTPVELKPGQVANVRLEAARPRTDEELMDEMAAWAEPGTLGCAFEAQGGHVVISWIGPRTPAVRAGLAVGDQLVAVDGKQVADATDAFTRTRGEPGSQVALVLVRAGAQRTVVAERQRAGLPVPPP